MRLGRYLPCLPTFIRRRVSRTFLLVFVALWLTPTYYLLFVHRRVQTESVFVDGEQPAADNPHLLSRKDTGPLFKANSNNILGRGRNDKGEITPPNQKCVVPTLDVKDPVMLKFLKMPEPIKCPDQDQDWVTVKNGTLVYSTGAIKRLGDFTCDMHPFYRGSEDSIRWGDWQRNVQNNSKLKSDYFKVECKTTSTVFKKTFSQIRHAVPDNPAVFSKMRSFRDKGKANPEEHPSVLMLGFDSMSRMSWKRRLAKTRDYFINAMGGVELEGYNIMGDGTPAALFPLLTGKHEQEMHEARRNFRGAKPVDDFPWIWKDFSQAGYITSWGDSEVNIAPFNMRLLGFKNPPTDYYWRPYYVGVNREMKSKDTLCQGSVPKHLDWFNRARDLLHKYGDYPKFIFHFYNSLSHGFDNGIMLADEDLLKLLQDLNTSGHLKHTLVILMGDHGTRFSEVRGTWSGKMEERLPYMGFVFPQSFKDKHPEAIVNFHKNVHRLTTPLDIHATLLDFLNFKDGKNQPGDVKNRAISLFKEIPLARSCKHANISNHWCACLEWSGVSRDVITTIRAAKAVVGKINSLTSPYRNLCAELKLQNITSALKLSSNKEMLTFKRSKDRHGLVPEFGEKTLVSQIDLYQVTFFTSPSQGFFEATVSHDVSSDVMSVQEKEISRMNKYGNASSCVLDKNRQLRQYCYCGK